MANTSWWHIFFCVVHFQSVVSSSSVVVPMLLDNGTITYILDIM